MALPNHFVQQTSVEYFTPPGSIIRQIWGKADTILFIFAGASAEFALNKAVDWLYFTGRLPADPLGRLFSTVEYARRIVFSELTAAYKAIDQISAIHHAIEGARGSQIPAWAYRDVLYMLIDYSIRSFELLERSLTEAEKQEVFETFLNMGQRMQIPDLPVNYSLWLVDRNKHLKNNLLCSLYTADLYKQYKKHLGWFRYYLLKQVQVMVVPDSVRRLLKLDKIKLLKPVIFLYKLSRYLKLDGIIKEAILPAAYKPQIKSLDI